MNADSYVIDLPPHLQEWVDQEAERFGMGPDAFIVMQLQIASQTKFMDRLRKLEGRTSELERKMSPGAV